MTEGQCWTFPSTIVEASTDSLWAVIPDARRYYVQPLIADVAAVTRITTECTTARYPTENFN